MLRHLKLSHHRHSGQLRSHEYTSYLPLMLILVLVGLSLTIVSVQAASPGPQSGSIGVKGVMPGPPPKVAPIIKSPANGRHFSESPVMVSGSCEATTLVELYKNDIFAGSGACSDKGSFEFQVDLLSGNNRLTARGYDALNQAGPESDPVTIIYDMLPTQADALSSLSFAGSQLLINTDAVYRGMFPGENFNVPITILGGTAPYAVKIDWGDSSSKVMPRADNQTFNATHKYDKAGTYQISIEVTDSNGRVAFMTVAAIVNGQPPAANTASNSKLSPNKLLVLWPLYVCIAATVSSFWLGERREKRVLIKHGIISRA